MSPGKGPGPVKERRATDRFKPVKAITVTVKPDGGSELLGIVVDISEGGACVVTDTDGIEVGATVELAVSFPDTDEPLVTTGNVRWTRKMRWLQLRSSGQAVSLRYGVHFHPAPGSGDRLKSLIARLAPS